MLRREFIAGVLDEKPRDRAERTVLQGEDSGGHGGYWQLNGQNLDISAPNRKSQCRSREHRQEGSRRWKIETHLRGLSDHNCAGMIEPTGAKSLQCKRCDPTAG